MVDTVTVIQLVNFNPHSARGMTALPHPTSKAEVNFNPHSARGMTVSGTTDGATLTVFQSTFRTRNDSMSLITPIYCL